MKKLLFIYLVMFNILSVQAFPAVLEAGETKTENNLVPSFLRQGVTDDTETIANAVEMYQQGWRYTLPMPKSNQAAWGNFDGRTTWWYGYWFNEKTSHYSGSTPTKNEDGLYVGDDQNFSGYYRRGGSPRDMDDYKWLLSKN